MKKRYWTEEHLWDQIQSKALPIEENLYPGSESLVALNYSTSDAIYAKNALQIDQMNRGHGGQQLFLGPGWYKMTDREIITQDIWLLSENLITG